MSVAGHAPPPFFKRGPAPLVRLVFFVSLSLILLVADLRFHTLEWARLAVATVAWPLQRITGMPIDAAGDFGAYLSRQTTLLRENEELRRRQLGTANLLLRQQHLEREHKRLRALHDMRARLPEIAARIRERVGERVTQLGGTVDPARLEQELVLLAYKMDFAEELDRLGSHVTETLLILDAREPAGRRLDFLMQEFNREANTLSSKSQDADTTRTAVDMKVLIEQMREQVQNVE